MDFKNYSPKLFSQVLYFYPVTKKMGYTVRYIVRLKEEIDGNALRRAFDSAMERYPYLRLKWVKGLRNDSLVYNDAPLVVLNTDEALTLGEKQTNGHLLALSYKRRSIYINNSHGLVDGRGRAPFLRSLLYYYYFYKDGVAPQMENVNLADSPIDPAEYDDPYLREIPAAAPLPAQKRKIDAMNLDKMGLVRESEKVVHCLHIDEQTMMKWCKSHDATPNVAIAILMSRAIKRVHPESSKDIVSAIACDLRGVLNAPKTHWSVSSLISLPYDDRIAKLDIKDQCTIYRGSLILESDPGILTRKAAIMQKIFGILYKLPTSIERSLCRFFWKKTIEKNTFCVSYSGKVSYGEVDSHIRGLYAETDTPAPLVIEVTVANGHFMLDIAQNWREEVYVKAFVEELEANGIPSEMAYVYDQRSTLMEV